MPTISKEPGVLYIVATPIGNYRDITLRALDTLKSVQAVICEEFREGSTLMKKLGIEPVELITLNEHNEKERTPEVVTRLWQGDSLALVSDCGTPVFSDPGSSLIEQVIFSGIRVIPIPGPSSLMAALSVMDRKPEQFYFVGFLPREGEKRLRELARLKEYRVPIILMDTPYRLQALLADIKKAFGAGQRAILATNLTLPSERIYRGQIKEILDQVNGLKAEFILILQR